MLTYAMEAAAAVLFGRAIFWHVPKLVMMLARGPIMPEPAPLVWPERLASPTLPPHDDAAEAATFMACPSAFWLEPGRWQRPTWPQTPTLADLRLDNTAADLALAYTLCGAEEQKLLNTNYKAVPRISSARRWDRFQGSNASAILGRIREKQGEQ